MAPGVRGANRTGRPFTGDHAGWLLYETLIRAGFGTGTYAADPGDGVSLRGCRVTNAVRCVPPANLPRPEETRRCNQFLTHEIASMPRLRVILALGLLAHGAVLRAHGLSLARTPFRHGAMHTLPASPATAVPIILTDSYHVSRYNTNTGRLTTAMFETVIAAIHDQLDA